MNPIQAVTIVSAGGTMMQLSNQRGAPYPTTGYGALVFNTGPHLIDAVLENANLQFDQLLLPPGSFTDPAIQFTTTGTRTPGFYSTGPGNISLVGTDGTESSRAVMVSFDHPGRITAGGTIPPGDDSSLVPTTQWVNDTVATAISAGAEIFVGDTPPDSPRVNMLWWSSELGQLFVYYDDGNTIQWVIASPALPGAQGDPGPPGPQGEQGPQGEPGELISNEWYSNGSIIDPAAPTTGVVQYFVNGEPRVRPSSVINGGRVRRGQFRYTGNITVSAAEPWREIIENYGGGGAIDLVAGVYDLGGVTMFMQNGTNITVRSTFPLGATFRNGQIVINGGNTTFTNIKFEAPATGGGMFVMRGGFTQMIDCDVDGTLSTADSVFQLVGAQLNLRASLRDSIFTIGPNVIQQMIDADTGSAVKLVGSKTTQAGAGFWIKCVFAPGTPRGKSFLVLDTSKASISSLWVLGLPGLPGSNTVTTVDTGTDTISYMPATVFDTNLAISFANTGGAPPAPLAVGTLYFARDSTAGTTKVAAVPDGPAIDLIDAGTGTTTIIYGAIGTGIVVRRLSTCAFLGANTFEMLAQGVVVSNGALFVNDETRFKSVRLPLRGEYNFSMLGPSETELSDPLAPNGPQFFRDLTPSRTWDAFATGSACTATGTVLTVGGTVTGTWAVGQRVLGSASLGTVVIASLGTGTGGVGTYNLDRAVTAPITVPVAMSGIVYRAIGYDWYTQDARLVYSPNTPSTVQMTQNDKELVMSKSAAITTVALPLDVLFGYECRVSDGEGNAATFNTTVTAATGSGGTINGVASVVINTAFGSKLFRCLGDNLWTVISSI